MKRPEPCRRCRTKCGLRTRPARAAEAATITMMSANVLSVTEINPSVMNCSAGLPAAGSRNCGMNARKKAAVLGLSASTRTTSRNAEAARDNVHKATQCRAEGGSDAGLAASRQRSCRHVENAGPGNCGNDHRGQQEQREVSAAHR